MKQTIITLLIGAGLALLGQLEVAEANSDKPNIVVFLAENTLVFFLGDNGSDAPLGHQHAVASAAPLRGMKGAHYEGGMRVPFIAAWAKANADNPH